ncbi:MAG: hypothetical protein IKC16_00980 [Clostridia bacterium]|nr:hypothetical protein [Clostridia bacterium]
MKFLPLILILAYDKNSIKFIHRVDKMEQNNQMPITFQMALSHNAPALQAFLKMDENKQDNIINEAKKVKGVREMNIFVSNIGKKC